MQQSDLYNRKVLEFYSEACLDLFVDHIEQRVEIET